MGVVLFVLALLVFPGHVWAQEASPSDATVTAPQLAEVDGLKVENLFLKIQQQTIALDKLKMELQALLTSLYRPGFQITQGPDGALAYAPTPKPADAPPGTP